MKKHIILTFDCDIKAIDGSVTEVVIRSIPVEQINDGYAVASIGKIKIN
jgi:hypothetical protein